MIRPACALVALLSLSACAETPRVIGSGELERTQARLDELQHRDVESQLEIARLRKRIADLEAELSATKTAVAPDGAASRAATPAAAPADAGDAMAPALRAPSEAIEESDLSQESRTLEATPGDETTLYESALRQLRDGEPAEAEKSLRSFAARFPDSDLADNAWFWIGESRRVRGDLAGALDAYSTAIERYPEGNKIPDALFKMGQVLDLEGRRDAAREAWTQLVRRYPSTAAAESARTLLSRP